MNAAQRAYADRAEIFLREHRADLVELAVGLISIDSQIPPFADERRIVGFLKERMAALGLPAGEILAADPARPNLIVRVGSAGATRLVLNGHVDTKPVGDSLSLWESDPLAPEIRDGFLFGLGSSDMKGAVAAMTFAAAAVVAAGAPLSGDLVLAFVADEEAGATLGSKFVAPRLGGAAACLIGEPSGWEHDWQGIHLVSRGVSCFRVRVRGTQMHSSLSDRMPSVNASTRMAELLVSLDQELRLPFIPHPLDGAGPTINAGVIVSGGVFFGVVPGLAEFGCDIRTLPGMTEADVRESLECWLEGHKQADPDLDAGITFEPGLSWVPPAQIDPLHPLVVATQSAAREVLGEPPPLSVFPGGTDAPWFDAAGIRTLPSFGPGILTCCHGPNEHVRVESLFEAARMYARIVIDYCGVTDG